MEVRALGLWSSLYETALAPIQTNSLQSTNMIDDECSNLDSHPETIFSTTDQTSLKLNSDHSNSLLCSLSIKDQPVGQNPSLISKMKRNSSTIFEFDEGLSKLSPTNSSTNLVLSDNKLNTSNLSDSLKNVLISSRPRSMGDSVDSTSQYFPGTTTHLDDPYLIPNTSNQLCTQRPAILQVSSFTDDLSSSLSTWVSKSLQTKSIASNRTVKTESSMEILINPIQSSSSSSFDLKKVDEISINKSDVLDFHPSFSDKAQTIPMDDLTRKSFYPSLNKFAPPILPLDDDELDYLHDASQPTMMNSTEFLADSSNSDHFIGESMISVQEATCINSSVSSGTSVPISIQPHFTRSNQGSRLRLVTLSGGAEDSSHFAHMDESPRWSVHTLGSNASLYGWTDPKIQDMSTNTNRDAKTDYSHYTIQVS